MLVLLLGATCLQLTLQHGRFLLAWRKPLELEEFDANAAKGSQFVG